MVKRQKKLNKSGELAKRWTNGDQCERCFYLIYTMVYNLYEWALPHGYGLVWSSKQKSNLFIKVCWDLIGKFFKKIVKPVLYRSMIVVYGYVFSYMNTLYELHKMSEFEQQITIEYDLIHDDWDDSMIVHSRCSETFECYQPTLFCA